MTIVTYIAIGLVVGAVSGIMGIGGGVLLVPALMWLCGFKPAQAAGTSLAILIPPIGLPAALRYYQAGLVDLSAAVWTACAFAVGAAVSQGFAVRFDPAYFRFGFGLLMIWIAVRLMLSSDSFAASAAAGSAACVLAWLAFLGLRALGRRHLPPPALGPSIRAQHEQRGNDIDYQI